VQEDPELEQLPSNQNRSATRNYEVDRMISHTRNPRGTIQRLTVAVIIDSKSVVADDGTVTRENYSDEEIAQFESLIQETIGFNTNRGDSVSVINQVFVDQAEELPEIPLWQSLLGESWLIDLVKQVLGAIGLLIVYLIFGRPFLRSLDPSRVEVASAVPEGEEGAAGTGVAGEMQPGMPNQGMMTPEQQAMASIADDPNSAAAMIRRSDATHEQKVEMARTLVLDDPARVANVMKQWVGTERG
jgi:flagellar M-ring protein FliF